MNFVGSDLDAFAVTASERVEQEESILIRSAQRALRRYGTQGWFDPLVHHAQSLARATYRRESGKQNSATLRRMVAEFTKTLTESLEATTEPTETSLHAQAERIAASIATAAISVGYEAAAIDEDMGEGWFMQKVWITMEDERVRPTHAAAHGQGRPLGEKFTVGGAELSRPGDMSAPIEEWINCRCIIGIDRVPMALVATGVEMAEDTQVVEVDDEMQFDGMEDFADAVPWHGVLAPEDILSGDGRKFAPESMRWRDLPLPLSWQKVNADGHDGSVIVGRIDNIWRDGTLIKAEGFMLTTPEADEAISLLAEGALRGVSIDADDATMELETRDGERLLDLMEKMEPDSALELDIDSLVTSFTSLRVSGATLCAIPAFMEAWVALGPWDSESQSVTSAAEFRDYDTETRKKMAENGEAMPDGSFPIADVEDLRNAIQSIGRASDPTAAKAHIKKRARALNAEDLIPDGWTAETIDASGDVFEFVKTEDGPGWLTHPVDTDRLRDYWTRGRGAAKIGWGAPGDFNRCRMHLAKYVKPQHLAGYCANRHYDALGFWPGDHARMTHSLTAGGQAVRLVSLTASGELPPKEWFENPNLTGPSPLVITEDGRIFGHLAAWGTCHIGFEGVCVEPPTSPSDYAYFALGVVQTDGGPVHVGQITMDTGHAGQRASARAAAAHYDNTGAVVADVAVGEDEWGIWYSGRMRPSATPEQVEYLRAAGALSGDWREINDHLELVAALGVNVPGFPIPRPALAASGGRQTSLVAAGIVRPKVTIEATDLRKVIRDVILEDRRERERKEMMRLLAVQMKRDPKSRMRELAEGKN